MSILPLVMTIQGLQPQAPVDIRNTIIDAVAATNPDYTANLPGSLIEDIASTDIAACVQSDNALVDLVNSITPNGANPFILNQFGNLYGLQPQSAANTSVYVIFFGPPGFVIVPGFIVSDGSYQYITQDGAIIGTDGQSLSVYAVSNTVGNWAVPAGSVTIINTSVPSNVKDLLSCTNPTDGNPSTATETMADFHERVMTAGLAASTGMSRYLKTLIGNIPGVQTRLISARQDLASGRYIVIVGGGDPYQVAYALNKAMFWILGLTAPVIDIVNISSIIPATVPPTSQITTGVNHNLTSGMVEQIQGVVGIGGLPSINNQWFTIGTIKDSKNFIIQFDSSLPGMGYTSGGTVSPNPIVQEITITDYPDSYLITFVTPAEEVVTITVIWETDSPNYVPSNAVAQAAGPALQDYINNLAVGTTPINVYVLRSVFLDAVSGIMPAESVVALNFSIGINGIGVSPPANTGAIYGDPNSYFYVQLSDIVVTEGAGSF